MSRLRVLHVLPGLGIGGTEMALSRLIEATRCDFDHDVVSLRGRGPAQGVLEQSGARVLTASAAGLLVRPGSVVRSQPSLVHGWLHAGNLMALRFARALGNVPVIWSIRGAWTQPPHLSLPSALARFLCAAVSHRPAAITYNAQRSAQEHEARGYSGSRREVIPNGFDGTRFRPHPEARAAQRRTWDVGPGGLVVGMLARRHPGKRFDILVEAVAAMTTSARPHLVLGGAGIDARNHELVERITSRGLADRTTLLGPVERPELLFPAFDVACLASDHEGLPNTVGEAMACGVPVVASAVGDAEVLVDDTGLLVEPGNVKKFAEALDQLVGMPAEDRLGLGAAARARILAEYPVGSMAQRTSSLYRRVSTRLVEGAVT